MIGQVAPRISLAFLTALLSLLVASLIGTVADGAESEGAPALGVVTAEAVAILDLDFVGFPWPWGYPNRRVYSGKVPSKMDDDWGVPPWIGTPHIFGMVFLC